MEKSMINIELKRQLRTLCGQVDSLIVPQIDLEVGGPFDKFGVRRVISAGGANRTKFSFIQSVVNIHLLFDMAVDQMNKDLIGVDFRKKYRFLVSKDKCDYISQSFRLLSIIRNACVHGEIRKANAESQSLELEWKTNSTDFFIKIRQDRLRYFLSLPIIIASELINYNGTDQSDKYRNLILRSFYKSVTEGLELRDADGREWKVKKETIKSWQRRIWVQVSVDQIFDQNFLVKENFKGKEKSIAMPEAEIDYVFMYEEKKYIIMGESLVNRNFSLDYAIELRDATLSEFYIELKNG